MNNQSHALKAPRKQLGQDIAGDEDRKDFRRLQRSVRPETRFPNIYQPD